MTVVVHPATRPQSNVAIAPITGGLKDIIINTGIDLATTVISNWISEKYGIPEKVTNIAQKSVSEALRESYGQRRTRKQRGKTYSFKNKWRAKKRRWSTNDNTKFFKYR